MYVPVKRHNLKYNSNYKSIKELDSISYLGITNLDNPRLKDTVLKRKQLIINKINVIQHSIDSNSVEANEEKLYSLQEIGYGKFVNSRFKTDVRKDYIGYTKKKVSTLDKVLYSLGIFFLVSLITTFLTFLVSIFILYLLFR